MRGLREPLRSYEAQTTQGIGMATTSSCRAGHCFGTISLEAREYNGSGIAIDPSQGGAHSAVRLRDSLLPLLQRARAQCKRGRELRLRHAGGSFLLHVRFSFSFLAYTNSR